MDLTNNNMKTYHCTDLMLNDLYFKRGNQAEIAKRYNYTPGYISQVKKKLNLLLNKPLVKDSKLLCFKCKNTEHLVFHHNHKTNELIALLCHSCNIKIEDNELDYKKKESTEIINTQLRENSERLVQAKKDIKILIEALRQINNALSKKPYSKEIITRGLEYL